MTLEEQEWSKRFLRRLEVSRGAEEVLFMVYQAMSNVLPIGPGHYEAQKELFEALKNKVRDTIT